MTVIPLSISILLLASEILASPLEMRDISYNAFVEPQILGRTVDPANCYLWAQTFPWTTCPAFLTLYNLTMESFYAMNPSVNFDCYDFTPGTEYCIQMYFPPPVSTDGTCGQLNRNVTCVGSSFGDCCGASGTCGSTDAYCAIGNCQAGNCPGLGYSTDGNCGPSHLYLMCGGQWGNCCSNAGKCGSTNAECGVGNCQYGACVGSTSTTSSTTSTSATPLPSPFSPSPDGTCGYVNQYMCTGTQYFFGYCCNAAGYCGSTEYDCTSTYGCQAAYGLCDVTVTVTVSASGSSQTSTTSSRTSSVPSSKSSSTSSSLSSSLSSSILSSSSSSSALSSSSSRVSSSSSLPPPSSRSVTSSTSSTTPTSSSSSSPILSTLSSSSSSSSSTSSSASSTPTLGIKNTVGGYFFVGCQTEGNGVRTLSGAMLANDSMTLEMCASFCQPYAFFGVEYGRECWCGNTVDPSSTVAALTDCSFLCPGNAYEYCGAGNRLELYSNSTSTSVTSSSSIATPSSSTQSSTIATTSVQSSSTSSILSSSTKTSSGSTSAQSSGNGVTPTSSTASSTATPSQSSSSSIVTSLSSATSSAVTTSKSSSTTIITSSTTTTSSAQPTQTTPIWVTRVGNFSLQGCYREPNTTRALTHLTAADNMTVEACMSIAAGYTYAGIEYGRECWYDYVLNAGAVNETDFSNCNMLCAGTSLEYCGGPNHLILYEFK